MNLNKLASNSWQYYFNYKEMQQNQAKRTPAEFFKQVFGRLVTVKLQNDLQYVGILAALDGNMNVVLHQW